MATRSLTRPYINFRDLALKSLQTKTHSKIKGNDKSQPDDKVALVSDEDIELGRNNLGISSLPPEWSDSVEEVQYGISKIQKRMKDLSALHSKHLNRPSMDDDMNEEHEIDITTQEITQLFHQVQRSIQTITAKAKPNKSEQIIVRNVSSAIATQLQDLSVTFKKGQSTYLKKMKNREEREKEYFNNDFQPTSFFMHEEDNSFDDLYDKGFTTAQMQMVEENEKVVRQREEEIQHIVRSITDLNMIFKDLSLLIIDQGTILDRIDYNVEQASLKIESGLQQLQKAEKHQKSSRKMLLILVLAVLLVIMITVLIIWKKNRLQSF